MHEFKFLVGTTVWNKRISLLQNRMNRKYYIYYFWWLIPVLLPILSPSLNVLSSCVCLITYLMTSTLGWLCIPTLCNPTKLQVSKNSLHSLQFYYNPGCKLKVQMHLSGTVSGLTVFSPLSWVIYASSTTVGFFFMPTTSYFLRMHCTPCWNMLCWCRNTILCLPTPFL